MRGRFVLLIVLVGLGGCLTPQIASRSMMERLRAVGGPEGPDVVVFDVAEIVEAPADTFVDRDLWAALDESAVGLDCKAALDDNGFRVGVVGGMPPGKLHAMLYSERTCPEPRRITMRSGNAKLVNLGSAQAEVGFEIKTAGDTKSVSFAGAQCGFAITPQRTPDGRVTFRFTPQLQHGGRTLFIQPAEGENWSLTGQKATEKYTSLSFDVTLAPSDYVVIGTRYDRVRTLGHTTFVGTAGEKPVQRLLVIRARPQGDTPMQDWSLAAGSNRSAPLALQAGKTSRGYRE